MNHLFSSRVLACLLVLSAGCKKDAATGGAPQGELSVTSLPVPGTGAEVSPPEQQALRETQAFLERGGDVNARDALGSTRLTDAAMNDFGDVVKLLVSKGADVDAVDDQLGQTALHFCALSNSARAAEVLIRKGANVNAKDLRGKMPLHEAAAAGSLEVLKLLLSHHADVKARDATGRTPIDRAARAHQDQASSILLAAGSDPAHVPPHPTPDHAIGSANVATGVAPPPTAPVVVPPSVQAPGQSPEVAAAGDLAEMVLWWENQSWVKALKQSMPRGVKVLMDAEPYDAEGWSEVELREEHAPDSGFDPNVSPMVGIFRVSRVGRKIEWMESVSGEFGPLGGFLSQRGLNVTGSPTSPPSIVPAPGPHSFTEGDFESKPAANPNLDAAVIVVDPNDRRNHVASINGPDKMGFSLPISVPAGTEELTVSLRLLHLPSTILIPSKDGSMPDGIRLRVRLLNELGDSAISEAVVRPTGQWREMEFSLYDLPRTLSQLRVEAIGMKGPVYVDDVRIVKP